MIVLSNVTCPSPATATRLSLRTESMVVLRTRGRVGGREDFTDIDGEYNPRVWQCQETLPAQRAVWTRGTMITHSLRVAFRRETLQAGRTWCHHQRPTD